MGAADEYRGGAAKASKQAASGPERGIGSLTLFVSPNWGLIPWRVLCWAQDRIMLAGILLFTAWLALAGLGVWLMGTFGSADIAEAWISFPTHWLGAGVSVIGTAVLVTGYIVLRDLGGPMEVAKLANNTSEEENAASGGEPEGLKEAKAPSRLAEVARDPQDFLRSFSASLKFVKNWGVMWSTSVAGYELVCITFLVSGWVGIRIAAPVDPALVVVSLVMGATIAFFTLVSLQIHKIFDRRKFKDDYQSLRIVARCGRRLHILSILLFVDVVGYSLLAVTLLTEEKLQVPVGWGWIVFGGVFSIGFFGSLTIYVDRAVSPGRAQLLAENALDLATARMQLRRIGPADDGNVELQARVEALSIIQDRIRDDLSVVDLKLLTIILSVVVGAITTFQLL